MLATVGQKTFEGISRWSSTTLFSYYGMPGVNSCVMNNMITPGGPLACMATSQMLGGNVFEVKKIDVSQGEALFTVVSLLTIRRPIGGAVMRAEAMGAEGVVAAERGVVGDGLVYLRTDTTGTLKPYFGQTTEANQLAREAAHARAFPNSKFKFVTIESGIPKGSALDIAEHNAIQDFTGGVAARRSSAVSNLRDPVGSARRPAFGLPEPK